MKSELKKVVWPTGKQVVKSTFATIGFVLLISIVLIALNYIFSFINTKWYDLVLKDESKNVIENNEISAISGEVNDLVDEFSVSGENEENLENESEVEPEVITEELMNQDIEDENTIVE